MRSKIPVWGLVLLCVLSLGFSRVLGVIVTQRGASIVASYDSLGWVEASRKAPLIQYRRVGGTLLQWASFGYFRNPSQEVYLQGLLNKALVKAAKKTAGVDAIINTEYWPSLNAGQFPQGRIHARGEMVRFRRVTP
ncbi:MAG: hypothetical protein KTQ49_02355 [Candidatus Omnitrophica bacterium]|nr:hypothetical protein [Candidatus Omnitrophota bacterium]